MNGATHGRRRRMQTGRVPPRLAMVIFGGTGDLARHMLIPALYRLWCDRLLPEHFSLIGTAVEAMDAARRAGAPSAVWHQGAPTTSIQPATPASGGHAAQPAGHHRQDS